MICYNSISGNIMKAYNLIQVGSFDVENFGDLLFPIVFEHEIKKRIKLSKLFLFSPNGGTMPFYNKKVYSTSILDKFCSSHDIDGIILGGGDTVRLDRKILKDYPESFRPSLSIWQYPILIANKYKIPSIFNCPGSPIEFGIYRQIVNDTLKMSSYISVRDPKAKEVLSDIDSPKVNVIIDSVNLVDNVYPQSKLDKTFKAFKRNIPHLEKKYIVLQVNNIQTDNKDFIENLQKLVSLINDKYDYQVVFSPIGYVHNDLDCLKKIYSGVSERNTIIRKKMDPETMLAVFSHSSGFIGTSLHGLVTSNVYRVPILAIDTQSRNKIEGYMHLCGLDNRIVKDITKVSTIFDQVFFEPIDYSSFNQEREKLIRHFDTIADIITNQTIPTDYDSLFNILGDLYELSYTDTKAILANYTTASGTITRFIEPDCHNHYLMNVPNNTTKLDITFPKHAVITINTLNVLDKANNNLPFLVSNYFKEENGQSIYIDPIITINELNNTKQIKLTLDFNNYSPYNIVKAYEEKCIKAEQPKGIKTTIRYHVNRVLKKTKTS